MKDLEKKLSVLAKTAHILNTQQVTWAVGASMLLYLKNRTDCFQDIDIMLLEEDVEKAKAALSAIGKLAPPNPDSRYKTRHFLEFVIDGIDVDVMAGLVIVRDGVEYDCALRPEQIVESIPIHGERIPLQSLADWRKYYALMGRSRKVQLIDSRPPLPQEDT